MRVLITGGAGYIGFHLARHLLNSASIEHVVIYDNFLNSNFTAVKAFINEPKVHIIRGDVLDREKLKQSLKDIQVVYHLAGIVRAPNNAEFSHLFEQVNHWGTAELCSIIEEQPVERLIYLSSASVYGFPNQPVSITQEPMPNSSYGHSKLKGEKQVERLKLKTQCAILRMGIAFGQSPSMHHHALINSFNLSIALREPILIHGNGEQVRPVIHVERVVRALEYFMSSDHQESWAIYNLFDFNLSINQLTKAYHQLQVDFESIHVCNDQRMNDLALYQDKVLNAMIGEPKSFKEYLKNSF